MSLATTFGSVRRQITGQHFKPFLDFTQALYQMITGGVSVLIVDVVDVANLAGTYANGTAGVGATLTKASAGAFPTIDGVVPFLGMRVLLTAQDSGLEKGLYKLTTVGSASVAWVLTRDTAFDVSAEMVNGTLFFATGAGGDDSDYKFTTWSYTAASSPTVGTTDLTFAQASAGTGIADGFFTATTALAKFGTDSIANAFLIKAIANGAFLADAATRALFTDGIWTSAKLAAGVLAADVTGRALVAAEFFDAATALAKFAVDSITNTVLLKAVQDGAFVADAATRALFAAKFLPAAKANAFVSTEVTATGAPQNVAHGLTGTPSVVLIIITEHPGTPDTGAFDVAEGAHDGTNVIFTATVNCKFKIFAWV